MVLPPKQESSKCGQEHVMNGEENGDSCPLSAYSSTVQGDAGSLVKAPGVPRRLMPRPGPPPTITSAQIGSESATLSLCHRARQDLQSAGRAGGQSRAGRRAHPEQVRLHRAWWLWGRQRPPPAVGLTAQVTPQQSGGLGGPAGKQSFSS